jgi:arsenate reductase
MASIRDGREAPSWDVFADERFDLVITVSDQAAGESCPLFPGNPKKLHWSIPDPAKTERTDAEIDVAFERSFSSLKERVQELVR